MKMKKEFYYGLLGLSLTFGGLLTSCVMEEETLTKSGEATVRIELNADAAFGPGTKAVNESDYTNKNNYTVQILKDGEVYKNHSYNYANRPDFITLPIASYTLKAFYGTDTLYSRTGFYVEGTKTFSVTGEEGVKNVSVDCEPVAGKLIAKFDSLMTTYFSDYKVVYTTSSITGEQVTWAKNDTDPWYIKVPKGGETVTAKIILTPKAEFDSKQTKKEVNEVYTLAPNKAWTLQIAPNYRATNGQLGISITIDSTTVDHNIDIVVPPHWL